MAYKYENKINEAFFKAGRGGRNVDIELLVEIQEVYRKAKSFDAIVDIEDNYNIEKGFSPCVEEYVEEVEEIVSEYMGRADDER